MKDATFLSVRNTLAEHLGVHPSQVRPDQQLQRDWGLDARDLDAIALKLEADEDIAIRPADLEPVRTVAQLVALVRAIRRREEFGEELTRARWRQAARRARTAPDIRRHRLQSLSGSA